MLKDEPSEQKYALLNGDGNLSPRISSFSCQGHNTELFKKLLAYPRSVASIFSSTF